ncbi:MAG: hypothetical protein FJ304_12680 [Planctomycetes bacterium]|nr:hypothetical protein [Planctomycetota bacterium]
MGDARQRTTWGNRLRLAARAVGLLGAVMAVGGLCLLWAELKGDLLSWERLTAAGKGANGEFARQGALALFAGAALALAVLALELVSGAFFGGTRRTAAGASAALGVAAAVALFAAVNYYSYTHYARIDTTRDKRFTLPPDIAAELGKLRGSAPTTIVVLQMHNTFGTLSTKRDSFTSAAERQVTEKVRDLVDQFREFGPQFNVVVLDTEAFAYKTQLDAATKDAPELKTAIEAAPENSIFFHANKRVQRLSFNEFMQLDKAASREADAGRGNLVLIPQGIETFARRVLAVQERRPKVAVCVVHEALSTARGDGWRARYTMAGLRKSLTDAGYDVTDIVLKKGWGQPGGTRPSADTREESTLERLEAEARDAGSRLAAAAAEARQFDDIRKDVARLKDRPWAERRAYYEQFLRGSIVEELEPQILAVFDKRATRAAEELKEADTANRDAEKKLAEALKDERPLQDRRMTDVGAKFAKQLADVDLLIVPRFTTEDAMDGPEIEAAVHALNREQVKVAKEFMKRGKPVLACLGPITPQVAPRPNEPPEELEKRIAQELASGSDEFEKLLAERGVELGGSLVLFDGETKALAPDQFGSSPSEVPPLVMAEPPTAGSNLKPNPVAAAVRLTARTAESGLALKVRAVRPVALAPAWQVKQPFAAELAFTAGESWNELQPFPRVGRRADGARVVVYAPKYEPLGTGDPKKGTRDEERRGPFPMAVALENPIPAAWMNEDYQRQQAAAGLLVPLDATLAAGLTVSAHAVPRPTQRTVVFGSGGLFTGKELTPAQERLLFHTVNWLTAREDRLPKPATAAAPEWRYPRVEMSDRTRDLWRAAAFPGLPVLAGALGLFAMMLRRMR